MSKRTVIFYKPEIHIKSKDQKKRKKYNRNEQRVLCLSEAEMTDVMRFVGGKTKFKV